MSRLTWRSRSVVAAGAAAVLVGTGVAALAATGADADGATQPAQPGAAPQVTSDERAAELRRSVDDLMSQVDALEASLAATPTPLPATNPAGTPGLDDNGGAGPAGVSDDGAGYTKYGHGDDHGYGDDVGYGDDHGYGDDDNDGDREGETESDDD